MKAKHIPLLVVLGILGGTATAQESRTKDLVAQAAAASPKVPADQKGQMALQCKDPSTQEAKNRCLQAAEEGWKALLSEYRKAQ